jgi:hypothetical protein
MARTSPCGRRDAAARLTHAQKFLDAAELIATHPIEEGNASVAASLAVLAGIAASDVLCCTRLGIRSRSQDHHDAEALLQQIVPNGKEAAQSLRRLLDLKETAQYGVIHMSGTQLKTALRQARKLLALASSVGS